MVSHSDKYSVVTKIFVKSYQYFRIFNMGESSESEWALQIQKSLVQASPWQILEQDTLFCA